MEPDDQRILIHIKSAIEALKTQNRSYSFSRIFRMLKNKLPFSEQQIFDRLTRAVADKEVILMDENLPALQPQQNIVNKDIEIFNKQKNSFRTIIQEIFTNSQNESGIEYKEIENSCLTLDLKPSQELDLETANKNKLIIRLVLFEFVKYGFLNQIGTIFILNPVKNAVSQTLCCSTCEKKATLLDFYNLFVYCFNCARGYHFKCVSNPLGSYRSFIKSGWQCLNCKSCFICNVKLDQNIFICHGCDHGFHLNCLKRQFSKDEKLCDECRLRIIKRNPIFIRSVKTHLGNANSTNVNTINNTQNLNMDTPIHRQRGRKRKITLLSPVIPKLNTLPIIQNSPDILSSLVKSKKFPDVTDEDVELYKEVQKKVAEQILLAVPSNENSEVKECTPCFIQFGKYEIKSWFSSPFPQEYATVHKLHICEFCLEYRKTAAIMSRHLMSCSAFHPPDNEIYRCKELSIWEVDGQNHKNYCQNLCLIAKLFLDHKTLYYDVEPFLFYILTIKDEEGYHLVGYFSKEKFSPQKYNVSCITTLPQYQKMGYGRFLIDFSYLLTREEGLTGSPEKPLSALGKVSYNSYWASAICVYLSENSEATHLNIKNIMKATGIDPHEISSTLQRLGLIKVNKEKKTVIIYKKNIIDKQLSTNSYINRVIIDETKLHWAPFIKPVTHAITENITQQPAVTIIDANKNTTNCLV